MASRGRSASYGFNPYHADEKEPTAAAASGRGSGEEGPPIAREGMTRLPKLEFIRILSRDPLSFEPYNVEALRGLVQEVRPNAPERVLRMVVDAFNEEMKEQFSAFQIWVLDEHAEKGYVEVPEWFVEETEEARRRIGDHIDVHLPERHFTTAVEDDGTEKLVFRFKEEKAGYELKFNKGSTVMSFSADLEPELRPAFAELLRDCSGSERYKSSVADKKKLTAAVLASGHRSDTDEGPAAAKRKGMTSSSGTGRRPGGGRGDRSTCIYRTDTSPLSRTVARRSLFFHSQKRGLLQNPSSTMIIFSSPTVPTPFLS